MLHLQQALPRNHHLSSFSPVCRSNENRVSTPTTDFDFWGDPRSNVYDDIYNFAGQQQYDDDDYDAYSPRFSTSPLLPRNHNHSYPPSPKSRKQAIIDGRRKLMEMIKDIPESSHELSLKDIVDKQQEAEQQKDIGIDERSLNLKAEVNMSHKKKKNHKNCKGPISRSQSMDSGVFLLKMFFPTSLGLKGKSTVNNRSNSSLKSSSERSDKEGDKEWWKVRFLYMGERKKSGKSSISGSTGSRRSSSNSRDDDSNFTPGCWLFYKKCSSRQQRGCRV